MRTRDALVSQRRLLEGIAAVEAEVERQKRLRADGDPFFRHTRWVLEEMRAALADAAAEYRPTAEVAELTGYSEETLRRHARRLHEGGAVPGEWGQMIVRRDGADWSFLVPSVPVKRSVAA